MFTITRIFNTTTVTVVGESKQECLLKLENYQKTSKNSSSVETSKNSSSARNEIICKSDEIVGDKITDDSDKITNGVDGKLSVDDSEIVDDGKLSVDEITNGADGKLSVDDSEIVDEITNGADGKSDEITLSADEISDNNNVGVKTVKRKKPTVKRRKTVRRKRKTRS